MPEVTSVGTATKIATTAIMIETAMAVAVIPTEIKQAMTISDQGQCRHSYTNSTGIQLRSCANVGTDPVRCGPLCAR